MGTADPRKTVTGDTDFRLQRLTTGWNKKDPPPARVKPAPVTFIIYLLRLAYAGNGTPSPAQQALADVICIAFFFLLRPGEYLVGTEDTAFVLADVHMYIGSRKLDISTCSNRELESSSSMRLHFTTQKNQRNGDVIAHGRSRHHLCCPVRAAVRVLLQHRQWFRASAIPYDDTCPFGSYYYRNRRVLLRPCDITAQLRFAARQTVAVTGINPAAISARSLRAGGAMALLCGSVNSDTIMLVGRWHSDSMLRYLHQEAQPVMQNLAATMLDCGNYGFLPTHMLPAAA